MALPSAGKVVHASWKAAPPPGVKVGDLVFRRGRGMWTQYFINVSTREKRFSHVGIVVSNVAECVIVHSEGNDRTGNGHVRLQEWSGFFSNAVEAAVFRYEGGEEATALFAERGMAFLGVPFDPAFDMEDSSRLYCTEFVRNVVNGVLGRDLIGWTQVGRNRVIAVDDVYRREFRRVFDSRWAAADDSR